MTLFLSKCFLTKSHFLYHVQMNETEFLAAELWKTSSSTWLPLGNVGTYLKQQHCFYSSNLYFFLSLSFALSMCPPPICSPTQVICTCSIFHTSLFSPNWHISWRCALMLNSATIFVFSPNTVSSQDWGNIDYWSNKRSARHWWLQIVKMYHWKVQNHFHTSS